MISLATLQTAAEQGFIYGLVALALYRWLYRERIAPLAAHPGGEGAV